MQEIADMGDVQEMEFSGSTEDKIARLIFYATRQGVAMSQLQTTMKDVILRMAALEEERVQRAIADARAEERDKAVISRLEAVEKAVEGLKSVLNKAIAVIASGIGLALLNWILGGGLTAARATLKIAGGV